MNKFFVTLVSLVVGLVVAGEAMAQQRVQGYNRQDGTYVQPYTRSAPDNSYNNNYGVRGNTNPYSGQTGTASPTYNDRTPDYNRRTTGDPGYVRDSSRNR